MSITIAAIVADLNDDLNKSESGSTLSTAMLKAFSRGLRWLSRRARWSCLHASKEDYAIVNATEYIAEPDNFRELDAIVVNDGSDDSAPLDEMSFSAWLEYREDETTADYDEPEKYAHRLKRFYLHPIADGSYTGKLWYWKWHPAIEAADDTILFTDEFYDAVLAAVESAYLEGKGQLAKSQYYKVRAEEEVGDLRPQHEDRKPGRVKYHDMG